MIGPLGKRELDPGLAKQRHHVPEAALHLAKIKATESKLETEAQRGKETTRVVEVKDVVEDDLRSNKKFQCNTDSQRQSQGADLGTNLLGVRPGVRPLHSSLCDSPLTSTASLQMVKVGFYNIAKNLILLVGWRVKVICKNKMKRFLKCN